MKISVPKQNLPGETRVPLVPAVVKKLIGLGAEVAIDPGAGVGSFQDDDAYRSAGAVVLDEQGSAWTRGDIVVTIHPPTPTQADEVREGAVVVGMLAPLRNPEVIDTLATRGVTAFSLEFLPRISRAQAMDVLTSQANVAGYQAVVLGAGACSKMFPMMITAAGTLAPTKVFVIGAGVAGLAAIATAKRLGAVVEAYDVRPEVKEQVQSVGGRFVELPTDTTDTQTAGGYAKQQTEDDRHRQVELMARHVAASDVVITTAAVFGRQPPLLIPTDTVGQMRAGSVIIDLAADTEAGRGNCEATKPGQRYTTPNGVVIEGATNLPALAPAHSSQLYANNMLAFLKEILSDGDGPTLDLEDDIQKATLITHGGHIVNPMVLEARAT